MKRKGLLAAALIAIVAVAAVFLYVAYQPQGTCVECQTTITYTSPLYAATGVPLNTRLLVTFSRAMDHSTITNSTITLKHGTTSNSGTVSYTGLTAIFTPSAYLTNRTLYTATVTTGVKDTSGRGLVSNYVWSFTTSFGADTTAPYVIGTSPLRDVIGDRTISATFSKAMDDHVFDVHSKASTTSISGGSALMSSW